ncbi:MAG: hypothetical protein QNJ34_27575 [Xenococcaceae cyanobacterium MO_188.B29]|nr:hypothetical protein [Xenococcaceae cyanobacterium MO_188.B29]
MATEQLTEATNPTDNAWIWKWENDFEDPNLKGKIAGSCQLTLHRRGEEFYFEYTFANCINDNTLKTLEFDVVISKGDDETNRSALNLWTNERRGITKKPSEGGQGSRKGTIPKQFFASGRIGKAGRKISSG